MFWPFLELRGQLVYCPLADFGACGVREGQDIYAQAVVAQPVTGHLPLKNAHELQGKIAVLQRGICDFVTKVLHAQQAGAIAALVANNSDDSSTGEAFVMDAGQRHDHVADTVSIPAMMVSRSHSTDIFQEIREAYLDRRELSFTIRFLGAQTASRVLAQQERLAQLDRNAARSIEMKQQREYQQQEATTLLRTRLGKAPQSKNNQNELQLVEGVHAAAALAMLHWCPMTTALVILDVQNYFTMRHGYGADRTADCTGSGSDEEFDIKRGSESTHASSSKGRSSVEFYERVDNVLIPTIQDVLLASRATEGMEVIYSVVESATRDGRERSRAHKHAGIHVPKHGFGAQVPKRIAPDDGNDIVLSRTGVNVFAATNLDYVLRNLMVTHIVVMGISVLGSVESCVQTALDRGYQVSVLKEAVISLAGPTIGSSKTSSMLESLSKRGVQILSTDDFVDKLQSFA
ncbi:Ubiquitin carboxyl-terminal hydrolase [Phytophthora cinnamomi]|uniref:Ubiquitin carboxyl-terminal hydrolase n=1 Tax=Phytophthora cinnamomi TaxID=4785 RepID=UPI00355A9482|nr:Ubiquitin carboxyl-terminal hydrolase [Phytophthora cinnamomi]